MPAGLGFMVQTILSIMGSQSLLQLGLGFGEGALSVRFSEGSLVLMAAILQHSKSSCNINV